MSILIIKNLKKSYVNPEGIMSEIVRIPFFTAKAGEQIALHGESGCGKTTFLNLVAGILQADEGSVLVDGQEMVHKSEHIRDRVRAQNIGYVHQTFNLLQGYTALENILIAMSFGKGADKSLARHLLDRVGLSHRMNYYPRQLSVGQQQRVSVARSLANQPKLLLADEPTGSLDSVNSGEVLRLIREIASESNASLVLVSHDRDVLKSFEKRMELSEMNKAVSDRVKI